MPLIRTFDDIERLLGGPTPAEERLIAACVAGEPCILGDGTLPPKGTPDPARRIRAEVLRYLITGGCDTRKVADWGVNLCGAHVTGVLGLSFGTARGGTGLLACRFGAPINALQAEFNFLDLADSHLDRLTLQGARIGARVILYDITAKDTIDLSGAEIGGPLECHGARLEATDGFALTAQRARITGDVFLCDVTAKTTICLHGAEIGGTLDCTGARLKSWEGDALDAQGARITGGLSFHKLTRPIHLVNFQNTHAGVLDDDPDCWPESSESPLDGFTYDRVYGTTDPERRIVWLKKGSYFGSDFYPQPFTQYAKVLREMGHDAAARQVLAERERLIRKSNRDSIQNTYAGERLNYVQSLGKDI